MNKQFLDIKAQWAKILSLPNARLIAAAPELLEAAKWFLIVTRPDEVADARIKLCAAIAKAEAL